MSVDAKWKEKGERKGLPKYYIEYGTDMNGERLLNLLPNYIPDYCLTGDKPVEYWHQLITQAFKKVSLCGD